MMAQWGAWFGQLGAAIVDAGNPVGQSSTVHSDGSVTGDGGRARGIASPWVLAARPWHPKRRDGGPTYATHRARIR